MSSQNKGNILEKKVGNWLRNSFGFNIKRNDLVRGYAVKRPYEADVHGIIETGVKKRYDLWVECKSFKINRGHVRKLVANAGDVRDAAEENIAEWYPDILMMCSSKGFDVNAIGWADKHDVYCVKVEIKKYDFVGKMKKEDFNNLEKSNY